MPSEKRIVLLLSYPRSGSKLLQNTILNNFVGIKSEPETCYLGKQLFKENKEVEEIDVEKWVSSKLDLLEDGEVWLEKDALALYKGYELIKTITKYCSCEVIYIHRNPLEAIISYGYHLKEFGFIKREPNWKYLTDLYESFCDQLTYLSFGAVCNIFNTSYYELTNSPSSIILDLENVFGEVSDFKPTDLINQLSYLKEDAWLGPINSSTSTNNRFHKTYKHLPNFNKAKEIVCSTLANYKN